MYILLCLVYLFVVHAQEDKECVTPHGEPGKCIFITKCPRLLEAIANPVKGNEEYLLKFLCLNGEVYDRTPLPGQDIFGCCGNSPDFTILNNSSETSADLAKLSDRRYCGLQHKDDFISTEEGDDTSAINEFPWVASILGQFLTLDRGHLCSGTLINNRYVLTSSHCVRSIPNWRYRQLWVRLGDYHKLNDTDCVDVPQLDTQECNDQEDYEVQSIIPHPFYNFKTGMNNILLLKLAKRVTYSDYVRPICLPIPGINLAEPDDILEITSIGSQWDFVGLTDKKIKTNATLITNEECEGAYSEYKKNVHPYLMCTTGFHNNTSPAEFEGCPLMFSRKHKWHIEGILIDRHFCTEDLACYYTRVSKYLPWIYRNTRDLLKS